MEITTTMTKGITITPLYKETVLQISLPNEARAQAVKFLEREAHDPEQLYTIRIEKARRRRSLDANAYAWALIGKLAQCLKMRPDAVYRQIIADGGAYTIVPIKETAVKAWMQMWQSRGLGWICEDIGACRNTPGYRNIKCWHGSSAYDQKEMSYFIDIIKQECEEQGIETMTPLELEELKRAWKG